ncbi:transposase [Nocardia brasiliensis]|uniref:transposase n=1 Tax=Nocardia brasiliensis TaxID=37326 RepID=UPI001892EE31|nr:transposase [Nocardia brasiliensis]MBF6546982.1 transposase [Nocardia brasiliensis]
MEEQYNKFELLAIHLDPRFGNIYEYNMDGGDVGYDVQQWTDELRDAVRDYLLHDIPADVRERLSGTDDSVPGTNGEEDVDRLLRFEPWEVGLEVHIAAVVAVPTLHELIGHLDDWPSEDERCDAETWLQAHGEGVSWHEIICSTRYFELTPAWTIPWRERPPDPYDLVRALSPGELLNAWEAVVGPADSDLTDDEWRLIVPHFGLRRNRLGDFSRPWHELDAKRRVLNGVRFKLTHDVHWSQLPARYGPPLSVYQSYRNYQRSGLFARLYEGLRTSDQAPRVVEWLEDVLDSDSDAATTSMEAATSVS